MSQTPKPSDPVNNAVGRRLRLKRELAGLSQSALGKVIGVSRIKIGQYESGSTAIPAAKLFLLAQYFQISVDFFFRDEQNPRPCDQLEDIDPVLNNMSLSLLRDFSQLDNPDVRKSFAAVMERAATLIKNTNEQKS